MLTRKMFVLVLAIMLLLCVAVPFAVYAQDTEVPPTVEAFPTVAQEPVTIEPQPTAVATEIPGPSPIDEAKIPTWLGVVAVVLVVGIISIAIIGIQKAAGGLPEWSRELILAGVNSGLASLDTYVRGTDTEIDDVAVAELRKLVLQLQTELRATKAQVVQNTADIAVTAQKVG